MLQLFQSAMGPFAQRAEMRSTLSRRSEHANALPYVWLLLVTALLAWAAVRTSVLVWDDVTLPEDFARFVAERGRLGAAIAIFSGDGVGMGGEYRTYGLSRLLQFLIWTACGSQPTVYALWITLSQGVTAMLLHALLRRRGVERRMALVLSALWLLSPFSFTHCFHHYSYLLLPVQILIGMLLYTESMDASQTALGAAATLVAILGGGALALTGEAALPLAFTALALSARRPIPSRRNKWLAASLASAAIALVLHYLVWRLSIYDPLLHQRFTVPPVSALSIAALKSRTEASASSLVAGLGVQVLHIVRETRAHALIGFLVGGLLFSSLVAVTRAPITSAPDTVGPAPAATLSSPKLAATLLVLLCASLLLYVFVMVYADSIYAIFPRRYGLVPYTLLCMAAAAAAPFLPSARLAQPLLGLFFATIVGLDVSLTTDLLPRVRAEDATVATWIRQAAGAQGTQAVLFANRFDPVQPGHTPDSWTSGLRGGGMALDLIESPFVAYWAQTHYVKDVLGVKNFGWRLAPTTGDAALLSLEDRTDTLAVDPAHVAVVANMSSDAGHPSVTNIRVFEAWPAYAKLPQRVTVERGATLVAGLAPPDEDTNAVTIDLGPQTAHRSTTVLADKRYAEPTAPNDNPVLVAYGQYEGSDSVYAISDTLVADYYASNRNGDFVYRLDFRQPTPSTASLRLDFWELFGRREGERLFAVDVKVDDSTWDEVARLDLAALAGAEPLALRVDCAAPRTVLLRLRKLPGSIDIPFVQGIRVTTHKDMSP